jgi:hypothetical protein
VRSACLPKEVRRRCSHCVAASYPRRTQPHPPNLRMADPSWTAADVAKALCDALVAAGKLRANPGFIREDREAKIAGVFECARRRESSSPVAPAAAPRATRSTASQRRPAGRVGIGQPPAAARAPTPGSRRAAPARRRSDRLAQPVGTGGQAACRGTGAPPLGQL